MIWAAVPLVRGGAAIEGQEATVLHREKESSSDLGHAATGSEQALPVSSRRGPLSLRQAPFP